MKTATSAHASQRPVSPGHARAVGSWLVAAGLVVGGCGPAERSRPAAFVADTRDNVADQVADQVAAVRAGRSSRVVAAAALADSEWEALRGLVGLTELVLEQGRADDDRAAILATLPALERLVLRESPLTDIGFARLAECRSLRDLNVPQAACTAAGIASLGRLERLKSLRLGGPQLAQPAGEGSGVAEAIATLAGLRSLHLIDVPIGDEGLAALQRLPGLWNLYLDGAGVSDEAWAVYFRARPNVHVHVDQSHHDRDPHRHE